MIFTALQNFDWTTREPGRIFHGRGQQQSLFNNIAVDWLPPVVLITLYREVESPLLEQLTNELTACAADNISSVILQRRFKKPVIFECLSGAPVDKLVVTEDNLSYQLVFGSGIHTGLFLDMAVARRWVRQRAYGKRVLNLFSYTCAFSVAAMAGQAVSVVNIDMSSNALARGRVNHRLNAHPLDKVSFFAHDIFRSWSKLKRHGPYDLIVVDPPSYQPGSFVTEKDYPRLVERLPGLLMPGAKVLFCLNDPIKSESYLKAIAAAHSHQLIFQERLDNPSAFADVDSDGALKVLIYQYPK